MARRSSGRRRATSRDGRGADAVRLVTLGVGAQNSPRHRPAGLLLTSGRVRIMIDGGPGAVPRGRLDAWLVTDERAELIGAIRRSAKTKGLRPYAGAFRKDGVRLERRRVIHTNHPTYGYRIRVGGRVVVWAPEFYRFPAWAGGADVMFAEGAGWDHPIRFAGGVGGHMDVLAVADRARRMGTPGLPAVALAAAGWRPSQPMPPLRNALARCGACRRARGKVEPKHNGGDEFG